MPRRSMSAPWLLSALLVCCMSTRADPFITRDQNPLLTGFGLPLPLPARVPQGDGWQWSSAINWGSSAIEQRSSRESLSVDAETREFRLTLGRRIGERFALQLQLPYFYVGGGVLDSFVDSYHDALGLPEGDRPLQPKDALRINYQRNGVTLIDQRSSSSGIGEVMIEGGYQLLSSQRTALAAWASLKAPTARERSLRGSGAVDFAVSLTGSRIWTDRLETYGQFSVTLLGDGDLLPRQQRDVVVSGMAGATFKLTGGLHAKLQLDVHSAVFDGSDVDYLGEATILNIGGEYRFQSGWIFDAGVSEDVAVETSPDFVLLFGLRRGVRGF